MLKLSNGLSSKAINGDVAVDVIGKNESKHEQPESPERNLQPPTSELQKDRVQMPSRRLNTVSFDINQLNNA
ncbi:hypothetical protein PHISP_00628 [Aspergillus sp. HF37]|nr:hypothetical protein PHISP_00628 [Aspergillus sp. HF37]